MGRLKRSEKVAEAAVKTKPAAIAIAPTRVAERVVSAHCPICGKAIQDRAVKVGYATVGHTPYFESIDWQADKPFGVSHPAAGRGSFKDSQPINPQDAPELFEAMKGRFLQALREWVNKGWISQKELEEVKNE